VQGKSGAQTATMLAAPYRRLASSQVGSDRYFALWSRDDGPSAAGVAPDSSPSAVP
jgi:hypothetical protein